MVWFRRDLRLTDNPAWADACRTGEPICALYVLDPRLLATAGSFRRERFFGHLVALDSQLREIGGRLRLEHGDPTEVVPRLAEQLSISTVIINADTTPYARQRDGSVAAALDVPLRAHWGTLVHAPGTVLASTGAVSRVFTPFYKQWQTVDWKPCVAHGPAGRGAVLDDGGTSWAMVAPDDGPSPERHVVPELGEAGAQRRLDHFLEHVDSYLETRDIPAIDGTSTLSCDLRFGTISPRTVAERVGVSSAGRAGFVRQLAWRDWYAHLVWEMPHLRSQPMKPETQPIEWVNDPVEFEAWKLGRTGFPFVDAGMRELATTGFMHNRLRMVCASFLVKDLLIDWRWGERWFRHVLLDADLTQNVGNWQWAAGTGPDSAPFFRVFNPTTQSRKFDGGGDYIRRWVPELASLSNTDIHEPSSAAPLDLAMAGVVLGDNYPAPIVDHAWARNRALAALAASRESTR